MNSFASHPIDVTSALPRDHCTLWTSIAGPFYNPYGSSVIPCFISGSSTVSCGLVAIVGVAQLTQLVFANSHGPFKIQYSFGSPLSTKSVGVYQLFKVYAIVLHVLLYFILMSFGFFWQDIARTNAITIFSTILFVILPLNIIEPLRSPVYCASSALFWPLHSIFSLSVLLQDTYGAHPVWTPPKDSPSYSVIFALEIFLCLNSLLISIIHIWFYTPSIELKQYWDLNGWSIDSVHDFYSWLFFSWLDPFIAFAYKADKITIKDVPRAEIDIKSSVTQDTFDHFWNKAVQKAEKRRQKVLERTKTPTSAQRKLPKFSLFWILIKIHWLDILICMVADILEMLIDLSQAFMLQAFIKFFTDQDSGKDRPAIVGYSIATLMFVATVIRIVIYNKFSTMFTRFEEKTASSLTAKIYQKSMKLSLDSRKVKASGDIITNLTVDADSVSRTLLVGADFVLMPIRLISSMLALSQLLGKSTLAGFATALLMIPISVMISNTVNTIYEEKMKIKDRRIRLTSEILNSIKSIKLFSWEQPLLKRLLEIRNGSELVLAKRIGIYNALSTLSWMCVPLTVAAVSLAAFTYLGSVPLIPSIVFPALTLFEVISEPLLEIPYLYSDSIEINVSLKRIRELFLLAENRADVVTKTFHHLQNGDVSVQISNGTFLWSTPEKIGTGDEESQLESNDIVALSDINFAARKGQLTCIVGKVGSGKSTLVKSLLGDIPLKDGGKVEVNGSTAYCSQTPWLANATVKENILFGCKFDAQFYQKTVAACQLLTDLSILPDGENTVVGEKGISVSGGQKARIALARAVYSRADVYILDDILSAVDAHVGKKIFTEVLSPHGILAGKTIILATNAVSVLYKADYIYLLNNGAIVEQGTLEEVVANGGGLAELIKEFGKSEVHATISDVPDSDDDFAVTDYEGPDEYGGIERVRSRSTVKRASFVSYDHEYEIDHEQRTGHTEEVTTKGSIKLSVYLTYFKACNFYYIINYAVMYGTFVGLEILSHYYLKSWSEMNLQAGYNVHSGYYLFIYAALGYSGALATFLGTFILWYYCVISGSRHFHDSMIKAILRSPMSFFETTPVGRIINRFSDDINIIDDEIIWAFSGLIDYSLEAIGSLVVIVLNLPKMFIVILLLMVIYNQVRKYYICAARELKRIRSACKSPVVSHLQESLNGIDTIKAHGHLERFIHKNRKYIDEFCQASIMAFFCDRWLASRLQLISGLNSFAVSLFVLLTLGTSYQFSPGLVGFVMVGSLTISTTLNDIVRYWASIENKSVSVERIIEYCDLPSEAEPKIDNCTPGPTWPDKGEIKFVDYTTKYRANLDPVLKNISIEIKAGEKIGIVGRTGAGKSTLSLALFRIIEATSGHIEIDGIDTSKIGLFDLRHKLNIIPQDSHAIEGSIRQNLDPFGEFDDDQLWKVLELASLKEHVEGMKTKKKTDEDDDDEEDEEEEEEEDDDDDLYDFGLSAQVLEGGSNLSAGQKQLLSLARSLLNPSQVLILDEATAAVDAQTDKIIQQTIRSEFKHKTILTIAHRLETVLDSDRVLVLGEGEVKEYDTPKSLLENTNTIFYSLCKEGGYLNSEII